MNSWSQGAACAYRETTSMQTVMSQKILPLTQLQGAERHRQQAVRAFAEEVVRPRVAAMDREARLAPDLLERLFSEGLMGLEIPEEFGGGGGSFFETILMIEELSRVDPAVAVCVDVQNTLVVKALLRWATPAQRRRHLPALARETLGAWAMSEPDAGSDAFSLVTRAEPCSDGYLLQGRKRWITNAAEARLFLLFANAAPEKGAHGVTAFFVECGAAGLAIGEREDKMGIRASSTCDLVLEQVFVPQEDLLGAEGDGRRIAIETLNGGRLGIAAQMVGLAQGAFEAAVAYAKTRRQFGQTIGSFQGVYLPLADLATEIEAARTLLYNGTRLLLVGAPAAEQFRAAAMAKYYASRVAEKVASQAIEIFGGNGYIKDFPVEKFYRDAKVGQIYEGTSNMLLRTIATTLIGAVQ